MEDSMDYSYGVGARDCDEQEETSTLRPRATETNPTEWTDEKHSLYLKSMEATFVNQLNKSLNLYGRHVRENSQSVSKSSKHKHNNVRPPSSQFKVLRDGRWSKTYFKRDDEESGALSKNPWIQHYKCSDRQPIRKFNASRAKDPLTTTSNQHSEYNFRLWRLESVCSNAEVTDQNFSEEDIEEEEEEEEEKPSRIHEMKRTRTSTGRVRSNNQVIRISSQNASCLKHSGSITFTKNVKIIQVVPFENIVQVDDVSKD